MKKEGKGRKIEWSEGTLSGNPAMCDAVHSLLKAYIRESKGEVSQCSQALTYQNLGLLNNWLENSKTVSDLG